MSKIQNKSSDSVTNFDALEKKKFVPSIESFAELKQKIYGSDKSVSMAQLLEFLDDLLQKFIFSDWENGGPNAAAELGEGRDDDHEPQSVHFLSLLSA